MDAACRTALQLFVQTRSYAGCNRGDPATRSGRPRSN